MITRDYKIIFVGQDVGLVRDMQCADDEAAIEQARRHFPSGALEIWEGNRLVRRLDQEALLVG